MRRITPVLAVICAGMIGCAEADGQQNRPQPSENGTGEEMARRILSAVRGADPVLCGLAAIGFREGWYGPRNGPGETEVVAGMVLTGDDPGARSAVAWALRPVEDPAGIDVLGDALVEPDDCARLTAAMMLARSESPAALRSLTGALDHSDPQVRVVGALGLGWTNNPVSIPHLIDRLQNDDDPEVRRAAGWALGRID